MTLGELKELAVKHNLDDDTQFTIETEDKGACKYTGVIRGNLLIGGHGNKLINLLPAPCLVSVPLKDMAIRQFDKGVTAEEKTALWPFGDRRCYGITR